MPMLSTPQRSAHSPAIPANKMGIDSRNDAPTVSADVSESSPDQMRTIDIITSGIAR